MKIKILNIVTMVGDGGLEMLICKIYKGLDQEKYEKHLCILTTNAKHSFIYDEFENSGTIIHQLSFNNEKITFKTFIINIKQLFLLYRHIKNIEYNIVHTHDFFPAFIGRFAVILNKLTLSRYPNKVYTTYHNIYYWLKKSHRVINKYLSKYTDKIICVSKSVMIDSLEKEKITNDKYKVIYNGLDPNEFFYDESLRNKFRINYGYNKSDLVIGSVGVISVRKGHKYLLKAFNELVTNYSDIKLCIVGSTRAHEINIHEELINFIKVNGLKDKIKIIEPIENVNGIYNMIDIMVMPSITEGFGLSAFEYMLTDRKCIFSDIPVFMELTHNGKFGDHFVNGNWISLKNILEKNIIKYNSIKLKNNYYRNFVKQNYNIHDMIKEYINLYNFSNK